MRGALCISVIKMENAVVSHPGSVLSPITFYLRGNRHPFECAPLLFIHCIRRLTIVQRVWCPQSPLWVFTWQHFLGNSASTKGKLLIRHETIASTAAITISDGTKHWLLLSPPFILIRNLPSIIPSTQPIHFPPPTSPLQSSMISPLLRREQEREREGRDSYGRRERWGGGEEIQEAQAAFHFRCLAMQLCPASTVLANSASSPWEAHLVHNLRPCNAVPGPQW